jgi:thiamine kinase-like enzyme
MNFLKKPFEPENFVNSQHSKVQTVPWQTLPRHADRLRQVHHLRIGVPRNLSNVHAWLRTVRNRLQKVKKSIS